MNQPTRATFQCQGLYVTTDGVKYMYVTAVNALYLLQHLLSC